MQVFEDDRFYVTTDPELQLIGSRAALSQRRHRGDGPRYLRVGKKILYRGRDLNEFLEGCVVEPTTSGLSQRSGSGAGVSSEGSPAPCPQAL